MSFRLLAVHAHPDDESSKGAATLAYYLDRGAEVTVVSCTGGEAGSILNPRLEPQAFAARDLAGLRRRELAAAQAVIGFDHVWLGYRDSGLPDEGIAVPHGTFADLPIEIPGAALVRVIRRTRPQVIVTYDENGGYPHPDHIRTHDITVWAIEKAADPGYASGPEGLGAPWQVEKLYYERAFHAARFIAIADGVLATDPPQAVRDEIEEVRSWATRREVEPTTRVPVGSFFERRRDALLAHASQVEPEGPFFRFPLEIERAVWPTEDYELVWSKVPTTLPEDDLFAGVSDA